MAVDADHGLVDVRHALAERADDVAHVGGRGVADGVGDVDRGGAGVDGRLDHLAEEVGLGAGGVLGRELDVGAVAGGPAHARHGLLDDLLLGHLQLELAMDGAGGQEDVDPRPLGVLDGLPGPVDVVLAAAGQAADDRPADVLGDLAARPRSRRARRWGSRPRSRPRPGRPGPGRPPSSPARFMLAPGDCSPSRSVVSKITISRDAPVLMEWGSWKTEGFWGDQQKNPKAVRPWGSVELMQHRMAHRPSAEVRPG